MSFVANWNRAMSQRTSTGRGGKWLDGTSIDSRSSSYSTRWEGERGKGGEREGRGGGKGGGERSKRRTIHTVKWSEGERQANYRHTHSVLPVGPNLSEPYSRCNRILAKSRNEVVYTNHNSALAAAEVCAPSCPHRGTCASGQKASRQFRRRARGRERAALSQARR